MVDEMEVSDNAKCPVCEVSMPTFLSRRLKFALAKYENAIAVYGTVEQVPWHYVGTSPDNVCQAINQGNREGEVIKAGTSLGWPMSIAWKLLPGRVFKEQDNLKDIFYKKEALAGCYFWRLLCNKKTGALLKLNNASVKKKVILNSQPG